MSAGEIIREIERLSLEEKAEVLSALLRSQPKSSKLSPDELVALAAETGFRVLVRCTWSNEVRPITVDDARMQLVLEKDER